MKILLFSKPYPENENLLYPMFKNDDEIIGTQWLIPNFNVKLKNFQDKDVMFSNEISKCGYKKYYST